MGPVKKKDVGSRVWTRGLTFMTQTFSWGEYLPIYSILLPIAYLSFAPSFPLFLSPPFLLSPLSPPPRFSLLLFPPSLRLLIAKDYLAFAGRREGPGRTLSSWQTSTVAPLRYAHNNSPDQKNYRNHTLIIGGGKKVKQSQTRKLPINCWLRCE